MVIKMKTVFEVKKEHLMLLRKMYVDWADAEFGAPCIYPKKPYGNSDVLADMVRILGVKESGRGYFKFELFNKKYTIYGCDIHNLNVDEIDELVDVLIKLHKETETVLQIVLSTGQFKEGKYELEEEYGIEWNYLEK
jgi:hypothetical protein